VDGLSEVTKIRDMTKNPELRRIANQPVTMRHGVNGKQNKGTIVPKNYGSTMGMKPADFKTFTSIAGQKIKRTPTYEQAQETQLPRTKSTEEKGEAASKKRDKFLQTLKERFQRAAEAESSVRKEALEDLEFFSGKQWDDAIQRQRQTDGRPCLVINRLPQFVRQVTNEQRQNRPSIQVNPVDDGADVETAKIIQGLIRHIEYDSGADAAYDTAFFGAASFSFGYFRVTTEYSGPLSFEQDIKIKRIRNPFTVYYDPNAKEADFSDADWAFVVETMSKEAFKKAHPDAELSKMEDWTSVGDTGWIEKDSVRVAEHFWREREPETLVLLEDGSTLLKAEWDELAQELGISDEQKASVVRATRETEVTKVKWAKVNGLEVLEETDWSGQWIPIVKVVGDELDIDGKQVLKGIVRDAKEPQRQYNFMKSAATEAIALAPKAPFVIAEGQVEGYERQWGQANTKSFAYLTYKPASANGQPMPPPQRMNAEPAIQAINQATMESADDLKAVTGIYDASLGAQGNETSGKAILARQQQAQGANYHYIDNLTRALRHCGRILLDLIPKIYDTPRVIRIIGEDGLPDKAAIGQQQQLTPQQMQRWQSFTRIYDLGLGKYDVTISTGPSYQSRRQEAVSSIIDLVKSFPPLMQTAGDILVKNMDWPGAQDIAKRLQAMLPPEIKQADGDDQNPQIPPEVQQHVAQMTAQNQQLTQQLQAAQNDLQNGISVKKLETDSRERIAAGEQRIRELELALETERVQIEAAKVQATIIAAQQKLEAQAGEAQAQRTFSAMDQLSQQTHEAAMEQMRHEHGVEAAAAMPTQSAPDAAQQVEGGE
jgi:hypothetical protein